MVFSQQTLYCGFPLEVTLTGGSIDQTLQCIICPAKWIFSSRLEHRRLSVKICKEKTIRKLYKQLEEPENIRAQIFQHREQTVGKMFFCPSLYYKVCCLNCCWFPVCNKLLSPLLLLDCSLGILLFYWVLLFNFFSS